ncbi:MAG: aspartate/glutamate racemase family protein [Burkholderiales bacterium]
MSERPTGAAPGGRGPGFVGLLRLDTTFPRPVGDVGNPNTFDFPVRTVVVRGATAARVVRGDAAPLLAPFVEAGRILAADGAVASATSCGFLAAHQRALADALPVPFAASALLQVAWLAPLLPAGRRVGVFTIDADALAPAHLEGAGAPADPPVEGLPPDGALARTVFGDRPALDREAVEAEVVAAGLRLRRRVPSLGAIVLECTNLPPYRDALMRATGVPVHDCNTLLRWLWAGAARPRPEEPVR